MELTESNFKMSSPNESTASRLQRIGRRTDAIPEQADRFQDEVLLEDAFVVSEDNNNLEPEESEQNNSDHQQGKYHFPHALKSNLKRKIHETEISKSLEKTSFLQILWKNVLQNQMKNHQMELKMKVK